MFVIFTGMCQMSLALIISKTFNAEAYSLGNPIIPSIINRLSLMHPASISTLSRRCFFSSSRKFSRSYMVSSPSPFDDPSQQKPFLPNSRYRDTREERMPVKSQVVIESPSINSRKISASIVIDGDIEDIWDILTGYDRLTKHVPNLTKSYRVSSPNGSGIRIFQEGAQKIIGFDFRASLTMDMVEFPEDTSRALRERKLGFTLVDSGMFSSFDGTWIMKCHSRVRALDELTNKEVFRYKTLLTYSVYVRPKGPVPVIALEWRIREDIPTNLEAVKKSAEQLSRQRRSREGLKGRENEEDDRFRSDDGDEDSKNGGKGKKRLAESLSLLTRSGWGADETLGMYISWPELEQQQQYGGTSEISVREDERERVTDRRGRTRVQPSSPNLSATKASKTVLRSGIAVNILNNFLPQPTNSGKERDRGRTAIEGSYTDATMKFSSEEDIYRSRSFPQLARRDVGPIRMSGLSSALELAEVDRSISESNFRRISFLGAETISRALSVVRIISTTIINLVASISNNNLNPNLT